MRRYAVLPHSPLPLLTLAMVLASALPAEATTARLRSLGGQADYLEDDANVRRWYASLVDYPQLAVLELGDLDHDAGGSLSSRLVRRGGGLHLRLDPQQRWGVAAVYFGEDLPAPDGGGWIDLLYARRFGRLAIGGSFLASSYSDAVSTHDPGRLDGRSNFLHELGLGIRHDLADGLYYDLAAYRRHAEVDYFHAEHAIAIANVHGWDSFGVRARLFHGLDERLAAVYRLEWTRDVRMLVDDLLADLARQDADAFAAGAALTYLPDPDNLLILSVDYRRSEDVRRARNPFFADFQHSERDWWRLDVRGGFESRVLPWLTLRAAAAYQRTLDERTATYVWRGEEEDLLEWTYAYRVAVTTPVTLGLGLHLGACDLDVVLDGEAPWGTANLPVGYPPAWTDAAHRDGRPARYTSLTLSYRF